MSRYYCQCLAWLAFGVGVQVGIVVGAPLCFGVGVRIGVIVGVPFWDMSLHHTTIAMST